MRAWHVWDTLQDMTTSAESKWALAHSKPQPPVEDSVESLSGAH